ncbi:MAG: hypothetical protein Q4D89_04445 [Arachnia propionica]|uniref:hypothetical protein n=1 Tax=Arachnia propionica TaxID=1750 RepID=UPI002709535F|nr:hypothetical protein [Arachnia propionica]
MARDIGPEMLQFLDDTYAKGEISKATYDAKRTEVLTLIQRGKAVELEPRDRRFGMACYGMALVWFLLVMAAGDPPRLGNFLIAAVGAVLWVLLGYRVRTRGLPAKR